MSRINGKKTHTYTHRDTPWEDQYEWHRMTKGDRAGLRGYVQSNKYTHTHLQLITDDPFTPNARAVVKLSKRFIVRVHCRFASHTIISQ